MSPIKNVIFIMLDTLQFNYLGCYGNTNVKTPNLDRFARQGFLFENAYSEGLPTIPVRRALMTGRFTLPYAGWKPLDLNDTSLTDMLWCREVQTALVYDTPPMRLPKYGYSRGFDFVSFNPGQELDHTSFADVPLDPALKPEDYTSPTMVFNEKGEVIDDDRTQLLDEIGGFLRQQQFRKPEDSYISRVMTDAQNWLSNRRDKTRPFLLWVDSFDPHEPWDPESVWKGEPCPYDPEYVGNPLVLAPWTPIEGRITERECEHIRALYMEKVELVDKWIGNLLDSIREQGLWDETMVIITSDHGQPMGNGEHGHGIAAAEHERIVIVRMSLQSCHRIVCREPYAGVGSDLPTVRHGIYPIRDSVLVKRFQILEKAHSVHRIDGQDSYFLRHNHNFLNETIVLISKSVIFVYGKCRLPPVQIQERTSE